MKPDYQRIYELEYDLGITDEKPPPRHLPFTDAPGAVLYYTPPCTGLIAEPSPRSPSSNTNGSTSN